MAVKNVMIQPMTKATLRKRNQVWRQFKKWETQQQESPMNRQKQLKLIGEWVDFFLSKHPIHSDRPNVLGIKKMHRSLSHLSHTK